MGSSCMVVGVSRYLLVLWVLGSVHGWWWSGARGVSGACCWPGMVVRQAPVVMRGC
jgi:hypothetical protein